MAVLAAIPLLVSSLAAPSGAAAAPAEPSVPSSVINHDLIVAGSGVTRSGAAPSDRWHAGPERPLNGRQRVGLTWEHRTQAPTAQVRFKTAQGWQGWQAFKPEDSEPDDGSAEERRGIRDGSQLVVPPLGAKSFQVRVVTQPGQQRLAMAVVDPGTVAVVDPDARRASVDAAAPYVITRAQWGANESYHCGSISYNTIVRAMVLHHTGDNDYGSQAAAMATLRSDYAYHTKSRGWCDIGYNIILDKWGNVYEGRRGSLTGAVVGAHAGGFNTNTYGISVLGNFETMQPSIELRKSLGVVFGWKAKTFGINPVGTTSLTSSGGGTSRYGAGTVISTRTILGHKVTGYTDCPGVNLTSIENAVRWLALART